MKAIDLGKRSPHCAASYHGTRSAYKRAGCRCPHARESNRLRGKRYREGRHPALVVDPTGTQRRLQALAAIGWNNQRIADRLGWRWQNVRALACGTPQHVFKATADRVAAIYRDLCAQPGPSAHARAAAARRGWLSPIAWDNIDDPNARPQVDTGVGHTDDQVDEIAVERAARGMVAFGGLRPVDRVEVFRQLAAEGRGRNYIRALLRINGPTYRALAEAAGTHGGQVAA